MASLDELISQLTNLIAKMGDLAASIQASKAKGEELTRELTGMGAEGTAERLDVAVDQIEEACQLLGVVTTALETAKAKAEEAKHRHPGGAVSADTTSAPPSDAKAAFDPEPYRRLLPPPFPPRSELTLDGPPRRTHGIWVKRDGSTEEIVSGEKDPTYKQAVVFAQDAGLVHRRGRIPVASHVEIKAATQMRNEWAKTGKPQHETLVINNRVCPPDDDPQGSGKRYTCQAMLPYFVPPGSTLTVHEPDGTKRVFHGRAQ